MKRIACFFLLGAALLALSGCGSTVGSQPPGARPDSSPHLVRIAVEPVTLAPGGANHTLILRDTTLVRQLYTTTLSLPQMPENIFCTQELGPHYTLTFQQGGRTLTKALAKREGCRPVSISGESYERQGTQEFWSQLDHALQKAARE